MNAHSPAPSWTRSRAYSGRKPRPNGARPFAVREKVAYVRVGDAKAEKKLFSLDRASLFLGIDAAVRGIGEAGRDNKRRTIFFVVGTRE